MTRKLFGVLVNWDHINLQELLTIKAAVNCIAYQYFTYPQCINSHMQENTVLQSAKEIQDNNGEYKRRLLLDILKERGIVFDLETNKMIDDGTRLETLLRVLQNEKEREIKKKKYHESSRHTDKSSGMEMHSYESVYASWYLVYKLYIMWLSCLTSNLYLWWT